MVKILSAENSVVSQYLHELRDIHLQTDRHRFAQNVERLGVIAGYEVSKLLKFVDHTTTTPLGTANTPLLAEKLVLNTILRAGLPLQRGISQILDTAELSYVAAGRKPETAAGVEIELSYVATPPLGGKVLIIADTMIATGKSLVDTYHALVQGYGTPTRTIIVGVIASRTGVAYVQDHIPGADLVVCAVDPELNDHFFIVPGLGDAGDLLYGPKAPKQTIGK